MFPNSLTPKWFHDLRTVYHGHSEGLPFAPFFRTLPVAFGFSQSPVIRGILGKRVGYCVSLSLILYRRVWVICCLRRTSWGLTSSGVPVSWTESTGRRAVPGYMPLSDRAASVAVPYAIRRVAGRRAGGSVLDIIEFILGRGIS